MLGIFSISCKKRKSTTKVEKAFYYWKSLPYSLDEKEYQTIKDLSLQKLYVKLFEVTKDKVFTHIPISKSNLSISRYKDMYIPTHVEPISTGKPTYKDSYVWKEDSVLTKMMMNLEVIPTMYINNNSFYDVTKPQLDSLADNIHFLCLKYFKALVRNDTVSFQEVQIDCDWTAKTKDNYFYLLSVLKKKFNKKISCTLRLYPYKYPDKVGVPPVDKVMLMCYNLTSPLKSENKNTIQDNKELVKYLKGVKKYPLHLDIALPVFSWMQIYQHGKFVQLVDAHAVDLTRFSKEVKPLWYEVNKDTIINEVYLRKGDQLKLEEVDKKATEETIALLQEHVELDTVTTISLFHLDSNIENKYTHEILNHFYSSFSH